MPTEGADPAQGTPFVRRFQDHVTLIEYDGRPVVVAREFGAMLDYADGGTSLIDLITGRWSDEFIPDVDVVLLRNGRLAAFKRICSELGLDLVDKRAPSLLLLTESGIQLVLARTEKPEGKTFRRWLVSEVIPAYNATKALPGPASTSTPPAVAGDGGSAPPSPPPPPPPSSRPVPRPAAPVQALRVLLDALHTAGQVRGTAYLPLDLALRQVEALPDPLQGLDALPIRGDVPDADAAGDSAERHVLQTRVLVSIGFLTGEDLERLDLWMATRPSVHRQRTRAPLALVDNDRGPRRRS